MIRGLWSVAGPLPGDAGAADDFDDGRLLVRADAWLDEAAALRRALGLDEREADGAALIAAAYRRWGIACCDRLLGDFAFAVLDRAAGRILLARDTAGARPLFHHLDQGRLAFDGDLDRLLAVPGVPRRLDEPLLAVHLLRPVRMLPALARRTFWHDVARLPAGHRLVVGQGGARLDAWHDWAAVPPLAVRGRAEAQEVLRERITRAVRRCTARPLKVASHLSGGLDCSAIALLAARDGRLDAAWTWLAPPGPDAGPDDIRAWSLVESLARDLGVAPRVVAPTLAGQAALAATDFTRHPVAMLDYEQHALGPARDAGIGVVLSGWGGDEFASLGHLAGWFDLLRRGRWGTALGAWRQGARPAASLPRALATWALRGRGPAAAPKPGWGGIDPLALPFVEQAFAERALADPDLQPFARPHPARGLHAGFQAVLASGGLAARIESWALAGARHGLAYRYPLLDREVLDLCFALPPEATFTPGQARGMFRGAMTGLLPDPIRLRAKPAETARVRALGRVNDAATAQLVEQARALPVASPFAWLDGAALQQVLEAPAADPVALFAQRQAARVRLLSRAWAT
ncbi:asparagine synthase-related protein [Zavarzinia sp. CC-PAN008]|uniref:asparagine synthase-related protein n=1 Tax=Zavarzinia sp. CC-PAN008 TaxID=3243332 RepID=UPI003F74253C